MDSWTLGMTFSSEARSAELAVAIHDPGELFDHREPRHVALQLRNVRQDLLPERRANAAEVLVLHLDPVAQVVGDLLLDKLVRDDPVDNVAADRHVELRKELRGLLRVED